MNWLDFFIGVSYGLILSSLILLALSFERPKKKKKTYGHLLTSNDKTTIKAHRSNMNVLAMWWGELNSWKWPGALLPSEPPPVSGEKYVFGRRWAIMQHIESLIGKRYINYYCNCVNGNMPFAEWEAFWNTHHPGEK